MNVALWFNTKWRSRAAQVGVYAAAVQMRKQGIPIEIALQVLL